MQQAELWIMYMSHLPSVIYEVTGLTVWLLKVCRFAPVDLAQSSQRASICAAEACESYVS